MWYADKFRFNAGTCGRFTSRSNEKRELTFPVIFPGRRSALASEGPAVLQTVGEGGGGGIEG